MSARIAALFLLALCAAGCPVPMTHTETLSAPVVGVLRQSDGTPVRGAPVAVAPGYRSSDCSTPTLQGTTDSAGAFRFPAAEKVYHVAWVIPNLDRVAPGYVVCVGAGDTLVAAYHGSGTLEGPAPPDSVTCVEWSWRGSPRAACSGNAERSLASGGRWIEGEAAGWYRVMLISEDSTPGARGALGRLWNGPARPHRLFFVVVQWLEETDRGGAPIVRTAVDLPFGRDVESAGQLALGETFGRWCATVLTTRQTRTLYWTSYKRELITFKLGPPGQARRVAEC